MPRRKRTDSLLIVGAGDQARVVLDLLSAPGMPFVPLGLVDVNQRPEIHGTTIDDVPVIGDLGCLQRVQGLGCRRFVVAVGDNRKRQELTLHVRRAGLEPANVIHPSATVSPKATIGSGLVIHHHAHVGTGARVDDGVIVNTGACVEHDCHVSAFAHIAPRAVLCGRVTVGDLTLVGVGACVRPQIRVGRRVVVGAGATVVEDVPDDVTVVGVPARTRGRR